MSRKLELAVDPTCISSGYCRHFAPDVFGATPEKKSYVKANPVEETPAVTQAYESCPVEAIRARDAESGAEIFPEAPHRWTWPRSTSVVQPARRACS